MVIENFNNMKDKIGTSVFMTDTQKHWVKTKNLMAKMKPIRRVEVPKPPLQLLCFNITQHQRFDMLIMMCILANTITMAMPYFGASDAYLYVRAASCRLVSPRAASCCLVLLL